MKRKTGVNRIFDNKLFWIIASVLLSVLLWMYVTTTEETAFEKTFPGVRVEFVGEDILRESRGLVVTNVETNSVSVRLSANRRIMGGLSETNITAQMDISTISYAGTFPLAYTLSYPSGVNAGDVEVLRKTPQTIMITVDRLSTTTVELKGRFEGTVAEGYTAEPMEFSPSTVRINGPEEQVSQVDHALVVIDRQDVDRTITIENVSYILVDADGNEVVHDDIELETETVTVTMPVKATKDVPLSVTLISGGGATAENCVVKITPETITLAGDAEILDGINKIDLGTIDLSAEKSNSWEQTFTIVIPNDTQNLTGATEATVSVEVVGLETKEFEVTNFSYINLSDGFSAEVLTQTLKVTVRGEADALEQISNNNLRAVADLAAYGSTTVVHAPAKVYVDGNAGAIGQYNLYVSIETE